MLHFGEVMPQVTTSSTTMPRVGKAVLFATTEVPFLTHVAQSAAGPSFSGPWHPSMLLNPGLSP